MSFVLSCCSTVDTSAQHLKERDIRFICFHYFMDGVAYNDDMGQTMSADEFYEKMKSGVDTRTSQINEEEFVAYFEPMLAEGNDVLHLCLSSGITGTVNSARLAAEDLKERYPDRKLIIIDSLAASGGFGFLVDEAADRRDEGMSIDEVADWVEKNKLNVNHWFFSTDLTFFIKGGRVSKTAGVIGQMLNICPMLNVDFKGRLIVRDKIRTKKKAIIDAEKRMEKLAVNGTAYNGRCYITHSACYDDARALADLIESHFPALQGKVQITPIGTTIGSHTGPGTVALFFTGATRVD